MNAILKYAENYVSLESIFTDWENAKSNPYNTSMRMAVKSGVFQGAGALECDVKELGHFTSQLRAMYQFQITKAELKGIDGEGLIRLCMDRSGHITVSGSLYDNESEQELRYQFMADQTTLKLFLQNLESYLK